jgi:hypothetical protein
VGTDLAGDRACLECHYGVGLDWARLSSHSLVLDCATCHAQVTEEPGPGHRGAPACARCHSQQPHPEGLACSACHSVHGAQNAYLVRPVVVTTQGAPAAIHFSRPEGASRDGLARAGVTGATPGTGLCEVCHAATAVYPASGQGAAHSPAWCPTCHDHANGFAPPQDH